MKINLPEQYTTRVEMLPLIDIVFLLLVFFIYAMLSMAVHRGMEVELPVSAYATMDKNETTLSVTIRHIKDGVNQIFVDDEKVDLSRLALVLKENTGQEKSRTNEDPDVLLFADRQVEYQDLFKVLDKINKAGLSRISLQADADQK